MDENAIEVRNLKYIYSKNTPFQTSAIENISMNVKKGSFTCIIGHTGCGKSTLIQHFNGLLKPSEGTIIINGFEINNKDLKELRRNVGLLFQYPEQQLFEETVYKDIAFGIKKYGYSAEEMDKRIRKAAREVGLSEDILERSIYELSGGQKRRAAMAGVFVMEPEILILDEPMAGLDPKGRDEILELIIKYHEVKKNTVIFVSHSMEDVARIADYIIVMNNGKIEMQGMSEEVFMEKEILERIGLDIPQITRLMIELNKINKDVNPKCFTVENALNELLNKIKDREDAR